MKLTVVGHWGAYPEKEEATSCYLLEHEDFKLLIDCGSGALSQLQQYIPLHLVDAVVLSHYHYDHIADIGPLQYSRQLAMNLNVTNKPLSIYGHAYDQVEFGKLAKPPYVRSILFDKHSKLNIGPFSVTFLETVHKARCFAMRIEVKGKSLTYSADSSYQEEMIEFAKESNVFICESSFYKGQAAKSYGHMTSIEAATIAQMAAVSTLILSHLPHFGVHQQLIKDAETIYEGKTILASKGLMIEIS